MTTINFGIKNKNLIHLDQEDILLGFHPAYVYEVFRLINEHPLFLDLHYERLVNACKTLNIIPPKLERLQEDIQQLILKNQINNNNIKIAVDQEKYAVYPIASRYPTDEEYLRGVKCALLWEERKQPEIKTFQKDLRKKSNKQISQQDIYESILVNKNAMITEGSRSNLFFIQASHLITAPDHLVLPGITRIKILEFCKEQNYKVIYRTISIKELSKMDAAFICGTSPGVLPISSIENHFFDVKNNILHKLHYGYHSKYLSYEQI